MVSNSQAISGGDRQRPARDAGVERWQIVGDHYQRLPVAGARPRRMMASRWHVDAIIPVQGETLEATACLNLSLGPALGGHGAWRFSGLALSASETAALAASWALPMRGQRVRATCAALVPIRVSERWWALPEEVRTTLLEQCRADMASEARRQALDMVCVQVCREPPGRRQFDYLAWFEFAPAASAAFDLQLAALRQTLLWRHAEREVELRMHRMGLSGG